MLDFGSFFVGSLIATAIFALVTVFHSLVSRKSAIARVCTLLSLSVVVYVVGYALEITSTQMQQVLLWNRVQYLAAPFIAPLWLSVTLYFTGKERYPSKVLWPVLFVIPVITVIVRWVPSLSHYIYAETSLERLGSLSLLQIGRGPWYLINAANSTVCVILASAVLMDASRKRSAIRRDMLLMVLASLVPIIGMAMLILNLVPYGLDIIPLGLSIGFLIFYVTLFKQRFLDLVPLAYDRVFSWSKDGILIVDANDNLADYNESAGNLFGHLSRSSIGKSIRSLFAEHPEVGDIASSKANNLVTIKNAEKERHFKVTVTRIYDRMGAEVGTIVTFSDVTEQIDTLRRLEVVANYDETTKIANRRHAMTLLQREVHRAHAEDRPFSLLMIDLDFFKEINDTYGHLAGDEYLHHVAQVCLNQIRSKDILGRYGGDEFIVGLPGTSESAAALVAERIRKAVEASPHTYGQDSFNTTISIGVIAMDAKQHYSVDSLLASADKALYLAKDGGRNRVMVLK